MKILILLSIIFFFEVRCRDLRSYVTNTICLEECKCQNTNNVSLEITECLRPIEITSNFNKSTNSFTTIRFNQATILDIGINAFNHFSEVEHIEFNSSTIRNMHPQAFFRDELSSITFTNCKFSFVPNIKCLDLEELVITNSSLKKIPKFEELPSLTILHFDGNRINTIKDKTFTLLESLEEVYLTNNEISTISSRLFYNNTQLSLLDLSHNLLTSYALEETNNLEILSLANNQLTQFDSRSSKYLKNLRSLDLSHNKITEVNQSTFINMPTLEMINLGYNQLTVLENNTFSYNSFLEKLILDGNNFKTLPVFTSHTEIFHRIYNFSCRKCGIISLSSFTFGSMPGLVQITLAGNNLRILDPKAFGLVNSLKILDLSNNKLTKLGGSVFSDNKRLVEINLSGNPLKTLDPKDFIDLKNLRKLDASNAQLISLWADNYEYVLNELEQLTISNNSIEDITGDDLKVMPNLKYIDLENNPIQCTIHLAKLIQWLTIHEVYSTEGANLLRTNEKLLDDAAQFFEDSYDHKSHWLKLAKAACVPSDNEMKNNNTDFVMNLILQNTREIDSVPKVDPPQVASDNTGDDLDDIDEEEDDGYLVDDPEAEHVELSENIINDEFSLNQATYIISVTSVFVITALIVLLAAVSITLVVLKKNNTLNINNANLPRIKIPRWENMPEKKHCGSVYRPLSEEILAPPTPKINRYEFKTSPTVHNANP
ncbi:hypothetical protein HHI36_023189 [Cryptolaemus montrouzieri]|uniref:Uncharacterized protein n=1 Tax=Cryptolaemus montrouzieri TaxID=559131 RepID=A0ABD2PGB9_9CUCU